MTILAPSFESIAATRRPGNYTEFSGNLAGVPGPKVRRILCIGQRLTGAAVVTDVIRRMFDDEQGYVDYGRGSQIGRMVELARQNNPSAQIYALPEEETAGAEAVATWTLVGNATANGTREFHIGSRKYTVSVVNGDDPTTQAAAIVAAITADVDSPVSAGNVAGVVTFTCKWKGANANELQATENYEDASASIPGTTGTPTAFGSGTDSDHDMAALVALIDESQYDTICTGFNLAADQALVESEYLDRWGGQVQLEGHMFAGIRGAVAAMVALGNARNSKHSSNLGCGLTQSATWEWAAAVGAFNDYQAAIDPARPQQRMTIKGLKPAKKEDMYRKLGDHDALLLDGVSTFDLEVGVIKVGRIITTEQIRNGAPSTVHLDVTTMRQLAHYRYDWNLWIASRHPNSKYGDDDDVVSPGQAIITDSDIRAEAVEWFKDRIIFKGLGRDLAAFKAAIQVGSDPDDPNRANLILTPKLMKQFRILATQMQFILA